MQPHLLKQAVMLGILMAVSACGTGMTVDVSPSHAESVCEDVTDCAQGGDNSWLSRCTSEARTLEQQSKTSHCESAYNSYYACADKHFNCEGVTPTFPGCDDLRKKLEECLSAAAASSACAVYDSQLASCPGSAGISPPGSPIVMPCTLNLNCHAQCYLSNVSNVCAPGLSELNAVTQCVQSCPPQTQ